MNIDHWINDVHQGDAAETLRQMPESSIHMAMTSPPYYGLRDYGVEGQIGLEESLDEYIQNLVEVGDELKRVLRDDGSWWLNLGDSYAQTGSGQPDKSYKESTDAPDPRGDSFGQKNKMLVPHRVAIALQDAGWIVRNDVTWVKPNPMPSSVKDRLNTTTEQIFHLVPDPDYWYDLDAIREEYDTDLDEEPPIGGVKQTENRNKVYSGNTPKRTGRGKNPGDVFEIPTRPFPEAHFAVYPPELVEKPIKATAPPKVCAACGTPYERVTEEVPMWKRDPSTIDRPQTRRALEIAEEEGLTEEHFEAARAVGLGNLDGSEGNPYDRVDDETEKLARETADTLQSYYREALMTETAVTDEWTQQCDCDTDEIEAGIVLDPFAGAGTTLRKAKDLGRRFIGIDINPDYVAMAQKRVGINIDEPERIVEDGESSLAEFADWGSDDD